MKPRARRRIHKIHPKGFQTFEQFFANHEGNPLVSKNNIIIVWFVRNQAQRGPASAAPRNLDSDGRHCFPGLKSTPDHFSCFLRSFEHCFLLEELTLDFHFNKLTLIVPMPPDLHLEDRHRDRRQDLIPVASDQNGIF